MAAQTAKDPDGLFTPKQLRILALFQKMLMLYGYLYPGLALFGCLFSGLLPPAVFTLPVLIFFYLGPLAVAGIVFRIHPPVPASALMFFSIAPGACLAVFMLVIHQTSEIFKRHGVQSGLWFGANLSSIEALPPHEPAVVTATGSAATP